MTTLTVFTPTYNRAHLLPRLYQSLCNQTSTDFCWLVIDDGSSDGTRELVEGWKSENKVQVEYCYKENGGMHTAHNLAYKLITTELNVCIDSDDYLPNDAVEKIIAKWKGIKNKSKVAGIIGLDIDGDGRVIGTAIPTRLEGGSLTDLYDKHGVLGDKKIVLRTNVAKQFPPYPEYHGERLVPLGILYLMIGQQYDFVYTNEILCVVEYQSGGSSDSILKQYRQSPRGFLYARQVQIQYASSLSAKMKNYTHLVSSALFAKDLRLAFKKVNPMMTLLMFPLGIALHAYIRFKIRK